MDKRTQLSLIARALFRMLLGGLLFWSAGCGTVESPNMSGTTPVSGAGAEYLLGAEDVLAIAVWRDEHLTKEVVVRPDGFVSFPLVGEVQAAGRTVEEVRADIAKRLAKFIPNPNVSVAATKVLSYRIYVLGRVNKPGEFMIGHTTDVLQALSLAGGLTPFASENDIRIIRRINGEQRSIPVPYGDLKQGKNLERNALLQRGDVVMVP
ncbi:polysaccharide biosynthesis/export family protein [Nitrospira lenta]|uniref:Putative polysaccharide export protein n=1 Tax=Nitrospira lenta TaxID=1436998 RepID=A0A330L2A6_9BACT|nr:polysaccharide biosynthesis/export family protein [Nitrospira lenta]SPP62982.1 putative polysaccharide export protein [Nitrospira lenta]